MKTIAFSFLCLCAACSFARPAQGDPGPRTSASPGSEKFERMILDCINEMRRDPRRFYDKYLPDYIREKSGRFTASYTRSLKKDMYQAGSLTPFARDPALEKLRGPAVQLPGPLQGQGAEPRPGIRGFLGSA